ncbi:MAG: SMI1/KNR4 family protein [Candidatus Sericytochromatia bacterium]
MKIDLITREIGNPLSSFDIDNFEKKFSINFPKELRDFYLNMNGCVFKTEYNLIYGYPESDNIINISHISELELIDNYLSSKDAIEDEDIIVTHYFNVEKLMSIGFTDTPYYDLAINVNLESEHYGSIYLINTLDENNKKFVANNLTEFFDKFTLDII